MDTFGWILFSYYISIGTLQVMLMKASGESAKGTTKSVAYSINSAMILVELLKIMCCLAVERWQGDVQRLERGESRRSTSLRGFAAYAVPGLLYAIDNRLKIPATVYLHPHVFALFGNIKVIFTALAMVMLLGKRFSVLQWASMALLGMSLCVAKVELLSPAARVRAHDSTSGSKADVDIGLFFVGIGLVIATSCLSAMAGVYNEVLLKKRDTDVGLWRKNIWTYQWGVMFNIVGFLMSSSEVLSKPGTSAGVAPKLASAVFHGYDHWVWAMICVTALLGISVSMIMKYFDNVVKCFGSALIIYTTTIASMLCFGSRVDAAFVLGMLVYSVSSYLYAGDHNQKLEIYQQFEVEINELVKNKDRQAQAIEMRTNECEEMQALEENRDVADCDNDHDNVVVVGKRY